MAPSTRRKREIARMKESILSAAGTLFQEHGYEQTTLRKIAQSIDYNPATIYNYYKNKEELFFALQESAFQQFYEEFLDLHDSELKADQKLRQMGEIYIRFGLENPLQYELMFIMRKPMNAAETLDPEWKIGAQVFELLKVVIQQCIEEGSMHITDVEAGAFMIWSQVHGLVSLLIMDRMHMIEEDHSVVLNKAFDLFDSMIHSI